MLLHYTRGGAAGKKQQNNQQQLIIIIPYCVFFSCPDRVCETDQSICDNVGSYQSDISQKWPRTTRKSVPVVNEEEVENDEKDD